MDVPLLAWAAVSAFIVAVLLIDLFAFHRHAHQVSMREAAVSSAVWVALGLAFGGVVWAAAGGDRAGEYFAGYLIEKSLSVDNIFVFALLFSFFAVPSPFQHRLLFWGVLGALVFRGAFILVGATLLASFSWVIYVFGAFLIYTGMKLVRHGDQTVHPERNPVLKLLRRVMPVTDEYQGTRFLVRRASRTMATPLLAVLVAVETTDVLFAVDSIPAIFAVTDEPFLVFTSNAFAILGLRALYFLLAGMIDRFVYLKYGLAAILVFVGIKMVIADLWHIPIVISLLVIAAVLALSVAASLWATRPSANPKEESDELSR
ncbi:MAG: TerC family protein [Actinomycetota bacterium]|nr:TerC family protein [Actinomycetota bacterium]